MRTDRRGQTILPEYVVTIFLVIAAISLISIYVQRALQARMRDARVYMMDSATKGCVQADASGGDLDCQGAANMQGGAFNQEYEPYYGKAEADVSRNAAEHKHLYGNNIYYKEFGERTTIDSRSEQLPPKEAD